MYTFSVGWRRVNKLNFNLVKTEVLWIKDIVIYPKSDIVQV